MTGSVDWIIIHGSRDPNPSDVGRYELERRHRLQQMLGCKYHAIIKQCGTLEWGRRLDQPTPHAGKYNSASIAVCLVGGWEKGKWQDNYTEAQKATLKVLIEELRGKYPSAQVITHRELTSDTGCPGVTCKELGIEAP